MRRRRRQSVFLPPPSVARPETANEPNPATVGTWRGLARPQSDRLLRGGGGGGAIRPNGPVVKRTAGAPHKFQLERKLRLWANAINALPLQKQGGARNLP